MKKDDQTDKQADDKKVAKSTNATTSSATSPQASQTNALGTPLWLGLALALLAIVGIAIGTLSMLQLQDSKRSINTLSDEMERSQKNIDQLLNKFKLALVDVESAASSLRTEVNQQLSVQKNQLDNELNKQSSQLGAQSEKLTALNRALEEQALHLAKTDRTIQSLSGQKRARWLLSEAYYLAKMASQKVFINRDIATAINLLQEADKRIIEINDLNYNYLRSALAEDLQALGALPIVDNEGIIVTLNTLIPKLESMPLITLSLPEEGEKSIAQETEEPKGWRDNLSQVIKEIKNEWIIVKRHNQKVEPLLTPGEYRNLTQNIILALQQAQIAALRQQSELYQQSVGKAVKWIKDFYIHNDTESAAVIATLEKLATETVEQKIPNQLNSVSLLSSVVNTHQNSLGALTP